MNMFGVNVTKTRLGKFIYLGFTYFLLPKRIFGQGK